MSSLRFTLNIALTFQLVLTFAPLALGQNTSDITSKMGEVSRNVEREMQFQQFCRENPDEARCIRAAKKAKRSSRRQLQQGEIGYCGKRPNDPACMGNHNFEPDAQAERFDPSPLAPEGDSFSRP